MIGVSIGLGGEPRNTAPGFYAWNLPALRRRAVLRVIQYLCVKAKRQTGKRWNPPDGGRTRL